MLNATQTQPFITSMSNTTLTREQIQIALSRAIRLGDRGMIHDCRAALMGLAAAQRRLEAVKHVPGYFA